MSRGRIKALLAIALAVGCTVPVAAGSAPFAYYLEVTPEEGPLVPAVEARYTRAYRDCGDKAVTTADSANCLEAEFLRQDERLNASWTSTFARITGPRHRALLSAQRRWLAGRDPFCDKRANEFAGGTIVPVIWSGCRVELTIRRTMWLETLK